MEVKVAGLSEAQKQINKYFPKKPIAYQPGLSLAFKSVNVGLLLSQFLYWYGKEADPDGWMFKTMEEMKKEIGLTRSQQDLAISKCRAAGVLETKLKGIPAKRHFKLNLDKLLKLLPALKQKAKIAYPNPPVKFVGNQQTITKSTHETTSQSTHSDSKNNRKYQNNPAPIGEILKKRDYK